MQKDREDYRLFRIWGDMKYRCNTPTCKAYPNYGGRGIKVCAEWEHYKDFYNDMWDSYKQHVLEYGEKQTTLDRIDVNGDYNKTNCRWATYSEQSVNQRDKSYYRAYNDESKEEYIFNNCLDFCREYGFTPSCIHKSIQQGTKHLGFIFTKLSDKERDCATIKLPTHRYNTIRIDKESRVAEFSRLYEVYQSHSYKEFVEITGWDKSRSALLNQFKRYLS